MPDMLSLVYDSLKSQLTQVSEKADTAMVRSERAELTGSIVVARFFDLPSAATGAGDGDIAKITDGRKPGEAAGAGTGVLAMFDPATGTWLNVSDYSQVQV